MNIKTEPNCVVCLGTVSESKHKRTIYLFFTPKHLCPFAGSIVDVPTVRTIASASNDFIWFYQFHLSHFCSLPAFRSGPYSNMAKTGHLIKTRLTKLCFSFSPTKRKKKKEWILTGRHFKTFTILISFGKIYRWRFKKKVTFSVWLNPVINNNSNRYIIVQRKYFAPISIICYCSAWN